MVLRVRPARADDVGFMTQMLAAAAGWRPGSLALPTEQVLTDPTLAHYIEGWPQPGDLGVIAEDGAPIGTAWLRTLTAANPGYGYVDDTTPELSVGVIARYRGTGVGTRLLGALLKQARAPGVPAVSLTVEPDNPAVRLYRRLGFVQIGENAGSPTMLLRLQAGPGRNAQPPQHPRGQ